MSIKHDNIVPSTWPGRSNSTGAAGLVSGSNQTSSVTAAVGGARTLSGIQSGQFRTGAAPAASQTNAQRLVLSNSIPPIPLPPIARYQVAGNPNSTDYGCGITSLPEDPDLPPLPPPTPIVQILGFYRAKTDTFVVGPSNPEPFDRNVKASQLIVGQDFYVQLRIQPSVVLNGFVPTKFTLVSRIGLDVYAATPDFEGYAVTAITSNFGGDYFRIPGWYVASVGTATLTFSAGQKGINSIFGTASAVIPVVDAPTQVTANVVQAGWYKGVSGTIDTVKVGETLILKVFGPPLQTFAWITPWGKGSATTDANSNGQATGTALAAGTYPFAVQFADLPTFNGTFKVIDASNTPPNVINPINVTGTPDNVFVDGSGGGFDSTDGGYDSNTGESDADADASIGGESDGGDGDAAAGNSSADGTGDGSGDGDGE